MKERIAVLRANPKDASLGRLVLILSRHYKVDCYLWDRQGDFVSSDKAKDVRFVLCRIRSGFYDLKTIFKLFLFEAWLFCKLVFADFDCVHSIDLDTSIAGLLAARLRSKKFVYHCLDPYYAVLPEQWPAILGKVARHLEEYVISHADVFIITDMLRLRQHSGATPREVIEIANTPGPVTGKERAHNNGRFLIGYIGSLVDGRNLDMLIETVAELEDEEISLIIGGFGPLESRVKHLAGHHANVRYTGWMPYEEVLELEKQFDVFVHITDNRNEGQRWVSPNKLFESMVFGRPIIVGEGTLAAERVREIGNGVVIPYGSKTELKKAILMLRDNPHMRKEMGEKGLKEYEEKWNPAIMEKRLLEMYRRII